MNVEKELAALKRTSPKDLRIKYAEVFGEESRSGHKEWLIKRIAWRIQELAEGGLSERAKRRAEELANDADLRLQAPATMEQTTVVSKVPTRLPSAGTIITRTYKGEELQVTVLEDGFQFEGDVYKSLSAVAKKITGTHTNGYLFFRLGQYGGAE